MIESRKKSIILSILFAATCTIPAYGQATGNGWTMSLFSCSFINLANPYPGVTLTVNGSCGTTGFTPFDQINFIASAICSNNCGAFGTPTGTLQLNVGLNGGPCNVGVGFNFSAGVYNGSQANPDPYLGLSNYAASTAAFIRQTYSIDCDFDPLYSGPPTGSDFPC